MVKKLVIIVFTYLSLNLYSQNSNELIANPVNIPLKLAGNFAELRANHFHMGVDIKTQGKEGVPIFSVLDGYVSRLKISSFGYGKVIYIDHPNGTTSVYAHLQRLAPKLDSLLRSYQKEQQSWEIELFFEKDQLIISKGELIAYSGNTGGSTAPHLHFEFRDTKTEHALNPLLQGLKLNDTRKPEIKSLKLFGVQNEGYIIPGKSLTVPIIKNKDGDLSIKNDTLIIQKNYFPKNGGIGIAVDAFDKLNDAENICGLYGVSLFVNGELKFGHEMNEISFDQSRLINTHRDISETSKNIHKLFRTQTNPLTIYKTSNLGYLSFEDNEQYLNIEILGYDERHNNVCLQFVIQLIGEENCIDPFLQQIYNHPKDSFILKNENITFKVKANTFYEPTKKTNKKNSICQTNHLIQNYYDIEYLGTYDDLTSKRYLAVGTKSLKTNYFNGYYTAKANVIGDITLKIDTLSPNITWIPKTNINNLNQLIFEIADWGSGIKTYYLYINDEWTIFEYEYKNKRLFSYENKTLPPNTKMRLEVIDNCNNIAVYEKIINRQN